jgi:S-adenosylmethionine decarboxylase
MPGLEWIVDAHGCDPASLVDPSKLATLFSDLTAALELHPLGDPKWHQFPPPGGFTGFLVLAESHLACHTFPEYGTLCLNLFCCRPRAEWSFVRYFMREFGAHSVRVRRIERPYQEEDEPASGELPQLRRSGPVPLV